MQAEELWKTSRRAVKLRIWTLQQILKTWIYKYKILIWGYTHQRPILRRLKFYSAFVQPTPGVGCTKVG